jgi:hypothetical protein
MPPKPSTQDATVAAQRRTGRPTTIGALLPKAAAHALDQRGFASAAILSRWHEIVGDELAAYAMPIEIKFSRQRNDQAILVLQVSNGAAATLLQMKAPLLLERVNTFLGRAVVSRLQAQQGPLPKAKKTISKPPAPLSPDDEDAVDAAVSGVNAPDVRDALRALGMALARRSAAGRSQSPVRGR